MERENVSLRRRVTSLLGQVEKEGMDHAHETHTMKKEMFNLRMQLEQTFRKTLQELDGQYQKKAFDAMSEESKNALMANARLKEELALQSVGVENLLQRYKRQDTDLSKHRVDQDILHSANSIQLNNIAGLKRHKYEQEARFSDMQLALHGMKTRLLAKEQECADMQAVQEELEEYKEMHSKSQARASKWKARGQSASEKHAELKQQFDQVVRLQATERIGKVPNQVQEDSMSASLSPAGSTFGFNASSSTTSAPPATDHSAIWNSQFPSESVKRSSKPRKLKPSASLPAQLNQSTQEEASVIRRYPQAMSTEKRWERESRFFVPG
jgi:hypothetical protein